MNTLNKTYAKAYFEKFGFNVLPLAGKKPIINWEEWQSNKQTIDDFEKMDWEKSTGIGAVMSINNLRCIDIDGVEDPKLVTKLLSDLGLPENYTWVIQSGSGEGYHIYCSCNVSSIDKLGGKKAVYKFKMKVEGICHHLELRWQDCQTALPPSQHESGGVYSFFNSDPTEAPSELELPIILSTIEKHCIISNATSTPKEFTKRFTYDKERLDSATDYLSQHLPAGCYDDWLKLGFAFASLSDDGEEYFVNLSLQNPNYADTEEEIRKKFESLRKDYDGRTTIRSIFTIAENYGWKKPAVHFWYRDEKNQIKISRTRFKRFLESEGYCKIKKDTSYLFVKVVDNVVEEVGAIPIKDFVLEYLYSLPAEEFEDISRTEIIDTLIKGGNQYFANQFFEFLITRRIDFKRDTARESYLFFENGYVKVTSNNVQLIDYKDLDGYVWSKQIITREYRPSTLRSDFEEFLHNVCRKNVERTKALKTAIGYLLNNFKDPNNAKAIVFIDEKLSEGSYGRSGKGLVIKAISKLRTVVIEDGRNFEVGKNFAFQRVNTDTNIVAIEDIRKNFQFDRLFSILTEGITIEKKFRDEIFIAFTEAPKIVISSNFSIKGIDDSTLDRQFIIEFSDHYNKRNRPVDEFGKLFFEGWTELEWQTFDGLMIDCLQLYLNEGLLPYEYVNLEQKQLIDETCQEFAEFCEVLVLNNPYNKKELYELFKSEYADYEKLTQGKFTRWLKIWARIKEVEVVEMKSGTNRTIEFKGMKEAA